MWKIAGWTVVAVICGIMSACGPASPHSQRDSVMRFETVYDNLDRQENTELHVVEYWNAVKGRTLISAGNVLGVQKPGGVDQVLVINRSRPGTKGFNIVLTLPGADRNPKIKPHVFIGFKGVLEDCPASDSGKPIIVLNKVELLD